MKVLGSLSSPGLFFVLTFFCVVDVPYFNVIIKKRSIMISENKVIADPTLSSTAKLVMIYLLEVVRVTGDTEIPFRDEVTALGVGKQSREVERSLKALEQKGYIEFSAKNKQKIRTVTINLVGDESIEEMLTYF